MNRRATISDEERRQMIAAAAYRRYEQRGGAAGDPIRDWLEAEQEVDSAIARQGAAPSGAAAGKSAFLRSLGSLLAESQKQLEILAVKAKDANAEVRRKYAERSLVAAAKYDMARGKLGEIREHTDVAWGHLKAGAEKAAHEMSVAVHELAALFK